MYIVYGRIPVAALDPRLCLNEIVASLDFALYLVKRKRRKKAIENKRKINKKKVFKMSSNAPEFIIRRPVYQQDELHRICNYTKPKRVLSKTVSKKCKSFELQDFLKKSIPIIDWLPKYNWKENIMGDLVAGFTVAVMHIPQGMSYALLGNVPPIVGIYMAFFPVLVYLIFGTSKHNSMGTFAVICMMTGKTVLAHSSTSNSMTNQTSLDISSLEGTGSISYSPIEVATAVTFTVAIIQLFMYLFRLGIISTLLSETLVSGFTTAAAIHVFTSQVNGLLGVRLQKHKGFFKLIFTYIDLFNNLDDINITAMIISLITIVALVFNNEILKPRIAKFCAFPVPIEMLVVVTGTLVSIQMDLPGVYNIKTVGHVPVGLPEPALPPISLMPDILLDSFIIAMVAYTVTMSMALIFAQKNNYEVDSNQELLAQGFGNMVGSFFSCMPFTASLSRSLIQQTVGGHSQLASLVSCTLLLSVLLWIGPFFEPLPLCVLASIIIVALKGMFLQVKQFWQFYKLSRLDAVVWMMTFLTVVLLDIEYGLLVGVIISLASLIGLSMRPYTCKLGLVPETELYLDVKRYKGTIEIPGIKMLHYSGGLNFASKQYFRNKVYKIAGVTPEKELARRVKQTARKASPGDDKKEGIVNAGFEGYTTPTQPAAVLRILILDFSALIYIDPTGVATLRSLVDEFAKIDVSVYITGCSGPVYETMRKCNVAECKEGHFTMFPTVGDAVNFAHYESNLRLTSILTVCNEQEEDTCMSRL
ncbi:solute carrier family 26 member 10 [Cephus cinctus]|uniref:Solute carrier family 26 member 10 n=1 Tax=Cephus cinctus TaxID=211228 RepID=A0AAJ7BHH5_CEPCN|nr:solute carrier family 26 member 10 [Cephus cinctus]